MITVGLIKELKFISEALQTSVFISLKTERTKYEIQINVKEKVLSVSYLSRHIWRESLDDADTMFGVESCDTIARIILLIDSGDTEQWSKLVYIEK